MSSDYAIVFLAMLGDNYMAGIITAVHSARLSGFKGDAVAMVNGVSKDGQDQLRKMDIIVIEVELITHKVKFSTRLMKERYEKWIHHSFTKWHCINLTQYKKVLFLDADVVVIKPLDDIFAMNAPCSRFDYNLLTKKSAKKHGKKKPMDPSRFFKTHGQKIIPVGSKISNNAIIQAQQNYGTVATAQAVLIEPSARDYKEYRKMLVLKESEIGVVSSNSLFTPDEQTITDFYGPYNRGYPITGGMGSIYDDRRFMSYEREERFKNPKNKIISLKQVDEKKSVSSWTEMGEITVLASTWDLKDHQRLYAPIIPTIVHYMNNPKPWVDVCDKWPDLTLWWSIFIDACDTYRDIDTSKLQINHDQLECHIHKCYVCEIRGENEDHKPGDADHCPVFKSDN